MVMVTKALANVVGLTLAASGYAVAKAEREVGKLTGMPNTDGNGVADSEAFQMGFKTWLTLNGINPAVSYEPTGNAGTRLQWLWFQSEGMGELPRCAPPPEDMKQTPILVANHISYMDGLVLASLFGAPKVIAKSGTLKTPIIGTFAKEIGVIEVDRTSSSSRAATLEAIAGHARTWRPGDRPLLLFPEGTTSSGVDIMEFKKGAFAPGAPVRPVVLCYTGEWDPANTNFKVAKDGKIETTSDGEWYKEFLGHFIHSLSVKVLPPYIPSEEEKADPMKFAENVRQVIASAYCQMRLDAEAGRECNERSFAKSPVRHMGKIIKEGAKDSVEIVVKAAQSAGNVMKEASAQSRSDLDAIAASLHNSGRP